MQWKLSLLSSFYQRSFCISILSTYNFSTGTAYEIKYLRMDQMKFVEDSLKKLLLGPFLNTLSHMLVLGRSILIRIYTDGIQRVFTRKSCICKFYVACIYINIQLILCYLHFKWPKPIKSTLNIRLANEYSSKTFISSFFFQKWYIHNLT